MSSFRSLVDDEQRTQGYFGGMRLNFLSLKFQQPVKGVMTMDDLMCRGLAIGTIGVALSFFSLPASADWQTPCSCEHLKSIMKTIKADEYAKQRYSEKVQEYEKKDPTPIVLVVQADDYTYFATKGLPNELKKQFGYGDTIGISRDAKSDRADQGKMDQYKKSAICRDDYESAVAHEKYHNLAGLKIKKMTPDDAKKADQARSLAKEEVAAYEAGLKVLRAARERLKAGCDWVCDSARKSAGGKSYKDHVICERSCPGTLASNMKVGFRCFNAKNLK